MILKKINFKFYFIILLLFSISINQYFGYLGLNPIDSFFSFNSGYEILNGYFPFKDYWTITGPFIAFVQSILFKILGVSWFSYVFHASIFNFILVIATFLTLYSFKLNLHYCFFYSFLLSILAYPSSGTPYVDHHASYLSIISIFCFIIAIQKKLNIFWFILPNLLGIAFLTKQAPTGHFLILIIFLSLIYFAFNFNLKKILIYLSGFIFFLFIFLTILYMSKIPFLNFFQQYILFPLSLGESRLEFFFPVEFKRFVLRFKLIHLSSIILLIVIIKNIFNNFKYIKSEDFIVLSSLIGSSYALIVHQLMTINGLFIFFVIPILAAFSHIFLLKNFKQKSYIVYFLIFLSLGSTIHYYNKYILKRDFMDLKNANFKNAVNAVIIDKKLKGLKWITVLNPKNPLEEINDLKKVIEIIKKDQSKKVIITDYQFISVILSIYDYSPSQVWFNYHVNPEVGTKYFSTYKNFFINKIKKNNIKVIYVIKPMWGGHDVVEKPLNKNCYEIKNKTKILNKYILLNCNDLK